MARRTSGIGEFALIERLKRFQNLSAKVVKGIGDDAAVLPLDTKRYQLFTTDMCVEGVHFLKTMPACSVGWKAMAVNVSDIAAMGGCPRFAVVSIGVPRTRSGINVRYLEGIYEGMHECARTFGVSIVGGDTVKSDKLVINVALLGDVEKKKLTLRGGAKPGDVIFVTGPLGGSLKSGRHLTFTPRVKEARWLVEHVKPTAMMDISDGLAGDLGHILKASSVGAVLDEASIPLHRGVTLAQALTDGEDFELAFTISFKSAKRLMKNKRFFPVGVIVHAHEGFRLRRADGSQVPVQAKGFRHF